MNYVRLDHSIALVVKPCGCLQTQWTWLRYYSSNPPQPFCQTSTSIFSAPGRSDLLAKCVCSVFSHYYPQYDPCPKGLMAENFPPDRLHPKNNWSHVRATGTCFLHFSFFFLFLYRGDIILSGRLFVTEITWLFPVVNLKTKKRRKRKIELDEKVIWFSVRHCGIKSHIIITALSLKAQPGRKMPQD